MVDKQKKDDNQFGQTVQTGQHTLGLLELFSD